MRAEVRALPSTRHSAATAFSKHRLAERLPPSWQQRIEMQDANDSVKLARGCADCGWSKWARGLDWDHVRGPKVSTIAIMIGRRDSWQAIEEEMAKCEVVCANCHRIRTHERRAEPAPPRISRIGRRVPTAFGYCATADAWLKKSIGIWVSQAPGDRDGPIAGVADVRRRPQEQVGRRTEVVLLLLADEQEHRARPVQVSLTSLRSRPTSSTATPSGTGRARWGSRRTSSSASSRPRTS